VYSQNHPMNKIVLVTVLLGACSPKVYETAFVALPPKDPEHIINVYEATSPGCLFEEVGILTAPFVNEFVSTEEGVNLMRDVPMSKMLEVFRSKARGLGGDALITPVSPARLESADRTSTEDINDFLSAIVIRFIDPDCRGE